MRDSTTGGTAEGEASPTPTELVAFRMASTLGRCGDSEQTGSVAAASAARRKAWQRQPPKSKARRSQVLQGSCIQASPRYF